MVWDIGSRQLVRTMQHKGAVANAFYTLAPAVMFDAEQRLPLISGNLRRMLDGDGGEEHVVEVMVAEGGAALEEEDDKEVTEDWATLLAGVSSTLERGGSAAGEGVIGVNRTPRATQQTNGSAKKPAKVAAGAPAADEDEVERLRAEIRSLKQINKKLYQFKVESVLKK